jgi:uncharacterized membrane protein
MQTLAKFTLAAMLTLAPAIAGCGDDGETAPVVDCTKVTPPMFAGVTAFQVCTMCHSSALTGAARKDAPSDVNYDTYTAAKAKATEAAEQVSAGRMPPSPHSLTEDQKKALYAWASCGQP